MHRGLRCWVNKLIPTVNFTWILRQTPNEAAHHADEKKHETSIRDSLASACRSGLHARMCNCFVLRSFNNAAS